MTCLNIPGKATPVGRDWNFANFGSLYEEPSRNGIYKTEAYRGRGTRIVNMGEMFAYERISDQPMSLVELTPQEASICGLNDGDLLFGRRSVVPAGAGKCSIVLTPRSPLTFESSIIRVRVSPAKARAKFYFYYFGSDIGRANVGTIIAGTNVKGIRASELRELTVPVPPIAEQDAIVGALDDADAYIDSLEHLLAKKRNIKIGAMQDLLTGKRRLPGFQRKSGFINSDIGAVPLDWRLTRIGECCSCFSGGTPSTSIPAYYNGNIPWITSGDLNSTRILEVGGRISADGLKNSSAKKVPEKTLLLALYGATAGVSAITEIPSAAINQAVLAIFPRGISNEYLLQYLQYRKGYYISTFTQGGQPNFSAAIVKQFLVALPSDRLEENSIAKCLSDMALEINEVNLKLKKARDVKQGMMQQLITGKIRLL